VCDFLDPIENPFYTLHFRVLRFPITESTMECIITNLEEEDFPMKEIKKLYEWRWGIERSFRELKYTIGLTNFHAKKVEYILQEIFARLIIYNFCERIITKIVIQQKKKLCESIFVALLHHFLFFHSLLLHGTINVSNIEMAGDYYQTNH
jgi:hypothetical protein